MVRLQMHIEVAFFSEYYLTVVTFKRCLLLLRGVVGGHVAEVRAVVCELDPAVLAGVDEGAVLIQTVHGTSQQTGVVHSPRSDRRLRHADPRPRSG